MKHPGFLEPLVVPNRIWEFIYMDFIMNLPRIQKDFDSIFVVIDKMIKVAQFIPTMTIVIALGVAKLLLKRYSWVMGHCNK